jgi:Trk K+ transport system NAD-binding subunit
VVRAAWRDTSALLREFRHPLIVFLIASFGGGLLYGFLHNEVAGVEPTIPLANLPYMMVSLMVLETPEEVPAEPYLIIFWYLMPALGVYVVGRGVADFARLFFDRSERRAAWEEALASTYRNHVIVLGVGHVGMRVVRTLVGMGFEVVGVELKPKPEIDTELKQLGVPLIVADGRLSGTLESAGLRYAQSLVVCTSNDQTNLEVTMRARDLNPDVRIVVRMWDNQFATQLQRFMGVQAVLSASDLSAPAFAGAAVGIEVAQTMRVGDVDYSMIRLQVEPGSFLDGQTIGALQNANNMDIVLHLGNGASQVHPDSNVLVHAGDTLVIFAHHAQIIDLVLRNRRPSARR